MAAWCAGWARRIERCAEQVRAAHARLEKALVLGGHRRVRFGLRRRREEARAHMNWNCQRQVNEQATVNKEILKTAENIEASVSSKKTWT